MKSTILSAALGAVLFLVPVAAAADPVSEVGEALQAASEREEATDEVVVERYLKEFFRNVKHRYFEEARQYVPQVVAAAKAERLDPLLVAIVVSAESTWKPKAVGAVGEIGLMQVQGVATKGFDVSTVEGNLAAGCAWLASRIRRYGLEDGITAYIGSNERAQKRGAMRLKAWRDERRRQHLGEWRQKDEEVTLASVAPLQ